MASTPAARGAGADWPSYSHRATRVEPALTAMRTHAAAALPHVAGDDYMVEHWLAAYAVLLMS